MAYLAKSMGSTYQEEKDRTWSAVAGPESMLGKLPHRAHTKFEAFYSVSFVGEFEKEY